MTNLIRRNAVASLPFRGEAWKQPPALRRLTKRPAFQALSGRLVASFQTSHLQLPASLPSPRPQPHRGNMKAVTPADLHPTTFDTPWPDSFRGPSAHGRDPWAPT